MDRILRTLLLTVLTAVPAVAAESVFENSQFRAVLGEDAAWRSLIDKRSGTDYCPAKTPIRFGDAIVAGKPRAANRASLACDALTISLAGCDTQLAYQVTTGDDWITFRLVGIAGARPSRATIVRVGATITEHVGSCLGGAWNDRCAVCLRGINLQTGGYAGRHGNHAQLATVSQDEPGPRLEGSGAALVVAPTAELRGILRRLAAAYGLPTSEGIDGVPSKDLPTARQSYWFLSFAERDANRVIDYCRRTGLRQVMMSSGSWCASVGHYTFNTHRYPDGIESLRRTVARLHAAGILVGMHGFASKVVKTDAYVTPVPNRGFWVDRRAELGGDVGTQSTEIRTASDLSQWPGSPVCKQKVWEGHVTKHQEVIVDDEIIYYDRIGPEGKWDTFLGCRRGAWGTRPAAHKATLRCGWVHQWLYHRPGRPAVRGNQRPAGRDLQRLRVRHGLLRRQRGRRPAAVQLLLLQGPCRPDEQVHASPADPHGRRVHLRTVAPYAVNRKGSEIENKS
ncbi:MAG: hypothetical protein ACLQNE_44920 [Thermoguttaceae bacterium]